MLTAAEVGVFSDEAESIFVGNEAGEECPGGLMGRLTGAAHSRGLPWLSGGGAAFLHDSGARTGGLQQRYILHGARGLGC